MLEEKTKYTENVRFRAEQEELQHKRRVKSTLQLTMTATPDDDLLHRGTSWSFVSFCHHLRPDRSCKTFVDSLSYSNTTRYHPRPIHVCEMAPLIGDPRIMRCCNEYIAASSGELDEGGA
jgi:hypothetical protein